MDDTRKVLLTRFAAEMFVAALLVAIGVLVAYGAAGLGYGWTSSGPDSGYVPFYLGWGIGLAGMGIAISSYLERERYRARVFLTLDGARDVLSFFLPIIGLVVASYLLGIYCAGLIYLFLTIRFQAKASTLNALLIALLAVGLFYVMFEFWFRIPLLTGPIEPLLGL
ncbi:tripartite tricarboxylate transporter TctB family protein [Ochrobactrum teleogrylli]|nr:tripartite tricarboxylate transporter TctB family protein [[Ochrobactrum] teleogrylli]